MNTAAPSAPTHIVLTLIDNFHRDLQYRLHKMFDLLQILEREGRATAEQGEATADFTAWFNLEARQHHLDEESHILPQLANSTDTQVIHAVEQLKQDHRWLEQSWADMEENLSRIAAGQNWGNMQELLQKFTRFYQLYTDHMVLEETIAFPAASPLLHNVDAAEAAKEMASRRQHYAAEFGHSTSA